MFINKEIQKYDIITLLFADVIFIKKIMHYLFRIKIQIHKLLSNGQYSTGQHFRFRWGLIRKEKIHEASFMKEIKDSRKTH